jgi:hypothetical protein
MLLSCYYLLPVSSAPKDPLQQVKEVVTRVAQSFSHQAVSITSNVFVEFPYLQEADLSSDSGLLFTDRNHGRRNFRFNTPALNR